MIKKCSVFEIILSLLLCSLLYLFKYKEQEKQKTLVISVYICIYLKDAR